MEQAHLPAGGISAGAVRRFLRAITALACLLPMAARAQTYGPNLFPSGSFENVTATYVPWAGVDASNNIHGFDGAQLGVGDDGAIHPYRFGPSIAAADMRSKGVQDLILGDTKGYFWYFPNSGTPQKPKFTQAEVMPIWLGEERTWGGTEGVDNEVPRIQLVDFEGSKKYDILAGIYSGKLYHIPNVGSSSQPDFRPTHNRDQLLINTHRDGVLWNNYMAPFMTTLFSSSDVLDLVTGEGTYSANSIYFLHNTNSSASPEFDEDHMQKIIPGMGLEDLTPVVLDWNNDGKPDILTGDRRGYLTLFLNTSTDPDHPTFDTGTRIKVGGVDKLGNATTVAIADLTGNKLPNLLIGTDSGTVLYALNTGKIGAPVFNTPATPLKGVLPPTYHHVAPANWAQIQAYGASYELLSCVNPQLQPGFTFPPGEKTKFALKFWVWPYTNIFFQERFYPIVEDENREHLLVTNAGFTLKLNTTYRVHFWVKADGNLTSLRYRLTAAHIGRDGFHASDITNSVGVNTSWTEISDEIKVSDLDDKTVTTWPYGLEFRFTGQTTFYLDDVQVQEELDTSGNP